MTATTETTATSKMSVVARPDGMTVYHVITTRVSGSNAKPGQAVYTLPTWPLHGTQPQYWTEAWRRKELLADLDLVADNICEADDMEEVIRQLHEAAGE